MGRLFEPGLIVGARVLTAHVPDTIDWTERRHGNGFVDGLQALLVQFDLCSWVIDFFVEAMGRQIAPADGVDGVVHPFIFLQIPGLKMTVSPATFRGA